MPRGLGLRGQGSLEQERRWKQYLEDERIALFLQNEEFMKELQRNRDFLLALERGEEHGGKPLSAFWPRASLQDRGPAVVAWLLARQRRAGCGQGRGGSPTCQHRAAGFVPVLLVVLSCPPQGSAPPAQQICGKEPWQCPPSPSQGDSQHGFTMLPCSSPVPMHLPSSPHVLVLPCGAPQWAVSTAGGQGNEHRAARAAQGSDQAGLGAFCFSDRLKYESKKSKSSSVAGSNDFGFSSILSGNFKRHKSITSRQLGASQLCPTGRAVLCHARPCSADAFCCGCKGRNPTGPSLLHKAPRVHRRGEGRRWRWVLVPSPASPCLPHAALLPCPASVPVLGAGMQLPGVTEPALALIGAEDCAWEA